MTQARITKPLFTPRVRYMMRKAERAHAKCPKPNPFDIVVERDETDPNRLNVTFRPEFIPYARILARITRQRIAVHRAKSRKRL